MLTSSGFLAIGGEVPSWCTWPKWGRDKWLWLLLWLGVGWHEGSHVQARVCGFELPMSSEGVLGLSYWLAQMWGKREWGGMRSESFQPPDGEVR